MPERPRQHQRVGRRALGVVHAVELRPRRPEVEHQRRVVADELVVADALEDEGDPRVEAVRHPLVRGVPVESLRGEPHPHQPLRGPAPEAPQSAGLAGQAVVALARRPLPVLGAVAPPHLDERPRRVDRRHPVEPVAAHVHQPAALLEVRAHPLHHLPRVVLRVGAGQHHVVGLEQRRSLGVQVVVGDDVDVEALDLEPVDEVGVGHELPRVARVDLRAHVGDGAQPRRVGHPAPVGVGRVQAHGLEAGAAGPGVGEIADGRGQERDVGGRRAARRPDEERHVVLARYRPQPRRVHAARQVGRRLEGEADLPRGVKEVVVVEVDGPVLLARLPVVHLRGVPQAPRHRARRQVHGAAVQPAPRGVAHPIGLDVRREVPRRHRVVRARAGRGRLDLGRAQRPRVDARVLDLAVVVPGNAAVGGRVGRHVQGRVGRRQRPHGRRLFNHDPRRVVRVEIERLLVQRHPAGLGVERRGHEVPLRRHAVGARPTRARNRRHPAPQRRLRRHPRHLAVGSAEPERQPPLLVDHQAIAAVRRPLRHHPLRARLAHPADDPRPRRGDPGRDREAPAETQRRRVRHGDVGAERQLLAPAGVVAVGRRLDQLLLDARSVRVRVAVDQPDDLGPVRGQPAAHHEPDRLARRHAHPVGVADDAHGVERRLRPDLGRRLRPRGAGGHHRDRHRAHSKTYPRQEHH